MSMVAAADYLVEFRTGKAPADGWQTRITEFLKQPEILVTKETKKGEKQVDIRPFIYKMNLQNDNSKRGSKGHDHMRAVTSRKSNWKLCAAVGFLEVAHGVKMSYKFHRPFFRKFNSYLHNIRLLLKSCFCKCQLYQTRCCNGCIYQLAWTGASGICLHDSSSGSICIHYSIWFGIVGTCRSKT